MPPAAKVTERWSGSVSSEDIRGRLLKIHQSNGVAGDYRVNSSCSVHAPMPTVSSALRCLSGLRKGQRRSRVTEVQRGSGPRGVQGLMLGFPPNCRLRKFLSQTLRSPVVVSMGRVNMQSNSACRQ